MHFYPFAFPISPFLFRRVASKRSLTVRLQNMLWRAGNKLLASPSSKIKPAIYIIIPRNGARVIVREREICRDVRTARGDSVYFTVPSAYSRQIGEVAVGRLWCKKRRGYGGCGVGERLRDYWTSVYFADIAPWYPFLLCHASLFLIPNSPSSLSLLPLPHSSYPAPLRL